MKLVNHGPHAAAVLFRNGTEIFFSYHTPVAGFVSGLGYFKTSEHYSVTTTRHINNYLGTGVSGNCAVMDQNEINNLVGGVE